MARWCVGRVAHDRQRCRCQMNTNTSNTPTETPIVKISICSIICAMVLPMRYLERKPKKNAHKGDCVNPCYR